MAAVRGVECYATKGEMNTMTKAKNKFVPSTPAERVEKWRRKQLAKGRCIICGLRASRRGGGVRRKCVYHLDLANARKAERTAGR